MTFKEMDICNEFYGHCSWKIVEEKYNLVVDSNAVFFDYEKKKQRLPVTSSNDHREYLLIRAGLIKYKYHLQRRVERVILDLFQGVKKEKRGKTILLDGNFRNCASSNLRFETNYKSYENKRKCHVDDCNNYFIPEGQHSILCIPCKTGTKVNIGE